MTKQVNVPNIRFAEYVDAWKTYPLSDLVVSIDSGWSPQCDEGSAGDSEWGVLKTTSIQWNGFDSDKNKKLPQALEPRKNLSLKLGDILVTRAGPNERVGVVSLVDKDYPKLMLSDKIIRLRTKPETNPSYLTLNLCLKKSNYQIMRKASGLATSQTNISQKFLLQTKLSIPTLPEQQKIASFLSKVDDKITLLTEKKDKLTEYKKGVMQQLFNGKWENQNGQMAFIPPTLRFKADDGSEFPDWFPFTLNQLVSIKASKVTPTADMSLPCIELDNLSQGTGKIIGNLSLDGSRSQKSKFNAGDVLFGKLRPYLRKYAHPDFEGICSSEIWVMSCKDSISNNYLFQLVQTEKFVSEANKSSGTKMPRAEWKVVSAVNLGLPSKLEQTKIADFLSVIDQKIDLTSSELEKAKQWKKGLLQQMFV